MSNIIQGFNSAPADLNDSTLPREIPFTKMHGTGNDYIYIEEFNFTFEHPEALARRISDRHFGIGSDGLVLIGPSSLADFRMRMFNADGSEAEMCGNASRSIGRYVFDRGLTKKTEFTLETKAGIKNLKLNIVNDAVDSITVNMGSPNFTPESLKMLVDGKDFINQPILVNGKEYHGTAVSMGNPHLVIPVNSPEELDLPYLGPDFERHPLFPRRVNTEFIRVIDKNHITMRVWERGSGETMACGTGACAVLAACYKNGWTTNKATIHLKGGDLIVEWDLTLNNIFLTGAAEEICTGLYKVR